MQEVEKLRNKKIKKWVISRGFIMVKTNIYITNQIII